MHICLSRSASSCQGRKCMWPDLCLCFIILGRGFKPQVRHADVKLLYHFLHGNDREPLPALEKGCMDSRSFIPLSTSITGKDAGLPCGFPASTAPRQSRWRLGRCAEFATDPTLCLQLEAHSTLRRTFSAERSQCSSSSS